MPRQLVFFFQAPSLKMFFYIATFVFFVGLSLESSYPYTSGSTGATGSCQTNKISPAVKVTGFHKLMENNYTDVMNAVATVGPLAVNVYAATWSGYSGGVVAQISFLHTKCICYLLPHFFAISTTVVTSPRTWTLTMWCSWCVSMIISLFTEIS